MLKGARMKKALGGIYIFFFITVSAVAVQADLDSFLSNLNEQARADMNGYSVRLSSQFGPPVPQIRALIKSVNVPADAFMCLHLSRITNIQLDRVVRIYNGHKHRGWGVMAKELGIKPGSAEFHALKKGDFPFWDQPGVKNYKGPAKGKGKGQGKGRGQGKGKGYKNK
jgi:hypothetical protein